MFLSFVSGRLGFAKAARTHRVRRPVERPRFRPSLLTLEGREVPSAGLMNVGQLGGALVAAPIAQLGSMVPLSINSVANQGGQLVAQGTLGTTPFTAPLTLTSSPSSTAATPILNLHLGPINLNLLGLQVKTSEICLAITAVPGSGNLLGNLLADVSHLLDQGTSLGTILGGLNSTQLTNLTNGLSGLLNGALNTITTPFSTASSAVGASNNHGTDVLNLSVGPVNLNLLGLKVALDNCAGGPITVDVTAVPGPGNLLGNLISDLAGLLDRPGQRIGQLGHLLSEIESVIGGLI
jgi:hypothetical protein